MIPKDVATRMRAIEDNVSGETREDAPLLDRFVAVLLGIDNSDDSLARVMSQEATRVVELIEEWYTQFGVEPKLPNYIGLSFVQGITFAVAAQRLRDEER